MFKTSPKNSLVLNVVIIRRVLLNHLVLCKDVPLRFICLRPIYIYTLLKIASCGIMWYLICTFYACYK